MATKEEMERALANAHKAGNTKAAKQIAGALSAGEYDDAGYFGASVIEPTRAIASGLGRQIVGGIAGGVQALNPYAEEGAGAATVEAIQEGAYQPQTEAGKEAMQTLGDLVQKGVDIVNYPISGLAAIAELVTGQGLEQAQKTLKSIQDRGVSETLGERVLEETDSPLAATMAYTAPAAIGEIAGLKGVGVGAKAAKEAIPQAAEKITDVTQAAAQEVGRATQEAAKTMFEYKTPAKQKLEEILKAEADDIVTLGYKLEEPTGLRKMLGVEGPIIVKDKLDTAAIKQGFDKGVIASLKFANPEDAKDMLKMVDIAEKSKKSARFKALNRPSDIAGDLLMDRFNTVLASNKLSGKKIDKVARETLKGKNIGLGSIGDKFIEDLKDMNITVTKAAEGKKDESVKDFQISFEGSDIDGLLERQKPIKNIFEVLKKAEDPDAYDAHRIKRIIDENISYGKDLKTLRGRTEAALRDLRSNIDGLLDENFPRYKEVNDVYSETIGAIDEFKRIAGKNIDLDGEFANMGVGTLMRRLMGNAQTRTSLLAAVNDLDKIAKKYGVYTDQLKLPGEVKKNMDRDLLSLVMVSDELDSVFGPAARTSLQGEFDAVINRASRAAQSKSGMIDVAVSTVAKGVEKARGINEKGAFKAIRRLLEEKAKKGEVK